MVNKDLVRLPLPRSHLVYAQVGLQRSVCDSSYCKKEKKVSKNFPFLMLSYCPQCSVNVRLYCDKEKQTPFVIFIINAIQISFCAAGEQNSWQQKYFISDTFLVKFQVLNIACLKKYVITRTEIFSETQLFCVLSIMDSGIPVT